jgi:hypothetical protein
VEFMPDVEMEVNCLGEDAHVTMLLLFKMEIDEIDHNAACRIKIVAFFNPSQDQSQSKPQVSIPLAIPDIMIFFRSTLILISGRRVTIWVS